MIWYKFHIGDYITHTLHLSDAEDLAYRRLLDLYYMSEKPLPLDLEALSRRIRLDLDIIEPILAEFFDKTEEGYRNYRCDSEIAKYQKQVSVNRELSKKGGRPKKTESVPNRNPTVSLTDTDTDKENTISSQATRFGDFWSVWPKTDRKVAKAACEKKWAKMALDPLADQIIASVTRLKASEPWLKGFEPAPMTFLNQRRWEDEQTESVSRRMI